MTILASVVLAARALGRAALVALALSAPAAAGSPPDPLMAAGPLPDIVEGSAAARVTIIEYASLTCSHCAAFHEKTWPALKKRYVATGKVRFILREFPLDPLAAAAFMLARCAGPGKRDALVDLMFDQQKNWAFAANPTAPLLALVKQAGMSQTESQTCLRNRQLYDSINQSRDLAMARLAIVSTPTFFVDGHRLTGETAIGEFDKLLAPLLK